jgi:hypothetical protein
MKTAELTGKALDWAVAKCEGYSVFIRNGQPACSKNGNEGFLTHYSTDWAQGGPIIERERITLRVDTRGLRWAAFLDGGRVTAKTAGDTPLIAAMRCYVASKLGDEINLPNEFN